jgi:glycosyltransferase involved in cell wall biosynthesis
LDVITKPDLRNELAQRSVARAAQFSWSKYAQETVNVYKLALSTA